MEDVSQRVDVAMKAVRQRRDSRPGLWSRLLGHDGLNFVLTNRVPRWALTRLVGRLARIESPLLTRLCIAIWRLFTDLDLSEAEPEQWRSLRHCFTRRLKAGARPIDTRPGVLTSPCDGIVGACGTVSRGQLFQAKGMPYSAADLFGNAEAASAFEGGRYVTLRLTSAMYHRFHAPADAVVERVRFINGDCWNVNPAALARVPQLFCRNERAALTLRLADGSTMALVPVAAILVASLRLHCIAAVLHGRWRGAAVWQPASPVRRGEEMGWFEHGSTIVVFVPPGWTLAPGLESGSSVRMGVPLLVPLLLAVDVTDPTRAAQTMAA
jgi:phosphatidylserine decarboxylase